MAYIHLMYGCKSRSENHGEDAYNSTQKHYLTAINEGGAPYRGPIPTSHPLVIILTPIAIEIFYGNH
jgi:hypothetical protein